MDHSFLQGNGHKSFRANFQPGLFQALSLFSISINPLTQTKFSYCTARLITRCISFIHFNWTHLFQSSLMSKIKLLFLIGLGKTGRFEGILSQEEDAIVRGSESVLKFDEEKCERVSVIGKIRRARVPGRDTKENNTLHWKSTVEQESLQWSSEVSRIDREARDKGETAFDLHCTSDWRYQGTLTCSYSNMRRSSNSPFQIITRKGRRARSTIILWIYEHFRLRRVPAGCYFASLFFDSVFGCLIISFHSVGIQKRL